MPTGDFFNTDEDIILKSTNVLTPKARATTNPYNVTPVSARTVCRLQPILLSSHLNPIPNPIFGGINDTSIITFASISDIRKIAHRPPNNTPLTSTLRTEVTPPAGTSDNNANIDGDDINHFSNASGMNMDEDDIVKPHRLVHNTPQGDNLPKSNPTVKKDRHLVSEYLQETV